MHKYSIPLVYKMWALVDIEASSLEEAIRIAIDNASLHHFEYIENSEEVDYIDLIEYNDTDYFSEQDIFFIQDNAPNSDMLN